jgi:hypothetical protein
MKSVVAALLVLLSLSAARGDDIADAIKAFASFVEYQKTDDIRALDLFSPSGTVVFRFTDGSATRTQALKGKQIQEWLRKKIAMKGGSKDVYEDVKFTQRGKYVWVTGNIRYEQSSKRGPFTMSYTRLWGDLKINHMQVVVPVDTIPAKVTLL